MYSFVDDEYIERVIDSYGKSMLTAAYALLKNTSDAEDAVQEAFIILMQKHPSFKDSEHEKAWLLRVTINISKNMIKSSRRNNLPIEEDIPYSQKDENEILSCVSALPERYRTIIHLYYYEGYSIKEIASILKLPPATVGTRLSRGRNILKTMLKGDFEL